MQFTNIFATLVLSTSVFATSMEGMDMSNPAMAGMDMSGDKGKGGDAVPSMDMSSPAMAGMDMSSDKGKGKDAMDGMPGMDMGEKKNSTSEKLSDEKTCKKMMKLTAVINLAANETKLEKVTQGNETKMADIKAMATAASAKLDALQQNTTLVATCEIIDSVLTTKMMCKEMAGAMKLIALASNQTELDMKTGMNATKADKIKAKAAIAQTKLTELQSNTTLTDMCTAFAAEKKETAADKEAASASAGATNAAEALGAKAGLIGTAVVVMLGMSML